MILLCSLRVPDPRSDFGDCNVSTRSTQSRTWWSRLFSPCLHPTTTEGGLKKVWTPAGPDDLKKNKPKLTEVKVVCTLQRSPPAPHLSRRLSWFVSCSSLGGLVLSFRALKHVLTLLELFGQMNCQRCVQSSFSQSACRRPNQTRQTRRPVPLVLSVLKSCLCSVSQAGSPTSVNAPCSFSRTSVSPSSQDICRFQPLLLILTAACFLTVSDLVAVFVM